MDERRIEEAGLNSWPALQHMLLDGWVVRLSEGYTKRANSVTPLYPSRLPAQAKIAFCERLYREKQLTIVFRLLSFVAEARELDTLLVQNGYGTLDYTLVLARSFAPDEHVSATGFQKVSLDEWLPWYSRFNQARSEQQLRHRAILQQIIPEALFAVYCVDQTPVACGLGVLEGDIFGLFDIVTDGAHRRKGYSTSLITSMLAWAGQQGGRQAYLQVLRRNQIACNLYAKLGFQELYYYWHRVKAPVDLR